MPDIVLIAGSPVVSSKSAALLKHIRERLVDAGLDAVIISIRDFPSEDLIQAKYDSPVFDEAKRLIAEAAGLVVATPVYKAAYSGALKTFLDILPQYAFRGKTVLPIASGGSPGHLLAIDYALKPVLSALAATDLLQGVYVVDGQFRIGEDGRPVIADEIRARLDESITQLVAQVKARALLR